VSIDLGAWNLTDAIVEVLTECLDRGMRTPLIMCGISPNGSVCAMRWTEGQDPEPLAEHFEPEGFRLPMMLVVLDQRNEAVRIVFTASGAKVWH
jgi:hypothetical protein